MSHLSSFQSVLKKDGFDAALVTDSINQRYLTGLHFDDGLVLVTMEKSYLLTDFRYLEAAKRFASPEFVILTPEKGVRSVLEELCRENHAERVAVEEESLSLSEAERLKELVKSAKLCNGASKLLLQLRTCKDDLELQTIARAQEITDAAFSHILSWMTPEMTEIDVALELEFFMRKQGAEGTAFDTIAVSGTNSALPHGVPRNKKLEKGFLTMDFGAKVDGYCSDMTRTVVIGKATAEIKAVYGTVLAAQKAALERAHEGASCRDLDLTARGIIDEKYPRTFGHSLGHGVGMFIHEAPRLSKTASPEAVLSRGNVVTFEPGIYLEGKYGCRIEDMACIKNDGEFYDFTKSEKSLIELF